MTKDMYSFFGLSQPAFGPITAPDQIFRSGLMEPVVKEILAGAQILSIRGAPGAGKTAFMHVLAMELQAHGVVIVMVDAASPTPAQVHALIGKAAGLSDTAIEPEKLLRALWDEAGVKRLVVLCDNAETLSGNTFRYLALLVQLRFTQPLRLQLLLLGQLGPWPGLADPDLEHLRQASTSRHITFSLRKDEVAAYLDHRLKHAGQPLSHVMKRSAVTELSEQAHCNPKRLDELAERALLYGYHTGRRRLTARSVRRALMPEQGSPRGSARFPRAPLAWAAALSILAAAGITAWLARGGASMPQRNAPVPETPTKHVALRPAAPMAPLPPPPPHVMRPPPVAAGPSQAAPPISRPGALAGAKSAPAPIAPSALAIPAKPVLPVDRPPSNVGHGPGLVLIAGPRDDLPTLYQRVYQGLTPPPYAAVLAANQMPVKPGALLVFPEPPNGWTRH